MVKEKKKKRKNCRIFFCPLFDNIFIGILGIGDVLDVCHWTSSSTHCYQLNGTQFWILFVCIRNDMDAKAADNGSFAFYVYRKSQSTRTLRHLENCLIISHTIFYKWLPSSMFEEFWRNKGDFQKRDFEHKMILLAQIVRPVNCNIWVQRKMNGRTKNKTIERPIKNGFLALLARFQTVQQRTELCISPLTTMPDILHRRSQFCVHMKPLSI